MPQRPLKRQAGAPRRPSPWALAGALLIASLLAPGALLAKDSFRIAWSIYVGWMPWDYAESSGILKKWADKYGIKIELAAIRLRFQPAAARLDGRKLLVQPARRAAQAFRQGRRFGVAGGHFLQADMVDLHALLAVIPLRQRNAFAQRNIVFGSGGEVEIEADARGDPFVVIVFGESELLHGAGGIFGVGVGIVVNAAIDAQEFSD